MVEQDENNLTDEELLQMWDQAEPAKIEQPPPAQTPADERTATPTRSRLSPDRNA